MRRLAFLVLLAACGDEQPAPRGAVVHCQTRGELGARACYHGRERCEKGVFGDASAR